MLPAALLSSLLSNCSGSYTLNSTLDRFEAFRIAEREVVDPNEAGLNYDFALFVRTSIALVGPGGADAFCAMGRSYESVDLIPIATSGCEWGSFTLTGNRPDADVSRLSDTAFLVRTANDERIQPLLVVDYEVSDDASASISFELSD